MSGFQGSISATHAGAPAGFINVAGARNGLTVDPEGFIVLGGDALDSGEQLLSNRNIDMRGFQLNLITTTNSTSSGINIEVDEVSFNDMPGGGLNGQVIIVPAGNQTLTGDPAQDFTQTNASAFYGFSNPAGSGKQADFRTASAWNPSAGSISYHAFADDGGMGITGGSGDYVSFYSDPIVNQAGSATGKIRGFHFNPNITAGFPPGGLVGFENDIGDVLLCSDDANFAIDGRVGVRLGTGISPTAKLHIGAATPVAGNGPLKLTAGGLLPAPETGLFEFDGTHLYFTIGVTRNTII